MGIFDFDRDVRDGFDAMFDWDHNGKIDFFEEGMQMEYMSHTDNSSSYSCDDEYDDVMDEIDGMDRDEARDYLESEGYDADDFDF